MDDGSDESMEPMVEVPPKEPGEKESGASRGIPDDTVRISVGKLRMLLERLTVFVNVPVSYTHLTLPTIYSV